MRIYTRKGDDGTTGLLYGGRVAKDSPRPEAYGQVDEAQAAIGLARALSDAGGDLDAILLGLERDLWVLMADLATDDANRHKLVAGPSLVTAGDGDRARGPDRRRRGPLRDAQRVRRPGRDRRRRPARRGPHRRPPGRAGRRRRRPRERRRRSPTSTGCPTCCGPSPAGRRARRAPAAPPDAPQPEDPCPEDPSPRPPPPACPPAPTWWSDPCGRTGLADDLVGSTGGEAFAAARASPAPRTRPCSSRRPRPAGRTTSSSASARRAGSTPTACGRRPAPPVARDPARQGRGRRCTRRPPTASTPEDAAQAVAEGWLLGAYRFDAHRQSPPESKVRSVTIAAGSARPVKGAVARGVADRHRRPRRSRPGERARRIAGPRADGRPGQGAGHRGGPEGQGRRAGRHRPPGARRPPRRQPGRDQRPALRRAEVRARRPVRRATSPSSARASPSTPAATR